MSLWAIWKKDLVLGLHHVGFNIHDVEWVNHGGELNFTLNIEEVWGPTTRVNSQASYFVHKLEEGNLVDVEPIIVPTWWNNKVGEDLVVKRLDNFLSFE